jgi:hypothetical protein
MKKLFLLLFVLLALPVFSQSSQIMLDDNTVIYGKVVGMSEGVYHIETASMGEIRVSADRIISISQGSQPSYTGSSIGIIDETNRGRRQGAGSYQRQHSSQNNAGLQEQASMRVQSMTMDDDFLDSLMDLSENSAMIDVLNDPEVMEAIMNQDYDFLMNNDKMRSLMETGDIRNLLGGY